MYVKDNFFIVQYPIDVILEICQDKNVCLWEDVLVNLGLVHLFKAYNIQYATNEEDKFNYKWIQLSPKNLDRIESILKNNLKKTRRKDIRFFKEEYRSKMFSWNAFSCAPYSNEDITTEYFEVHIPIKSPLEHK